MDTAERRILNHDRNGCRVGDACKVLEYPVFVGPKAGAMIWRHQHQQAGTARGRLAAPLDGDLRAEMAAGDDDRTATGDMGKAEVDQRVPLMVGSRNCSE